MINIHNNKKHIFTEEIPNKIRDISNKDDIEIIIERIVKKIGRKNKNKVIIYFNHYYCINLEYFLNQKDIKKIKYILILSETDTEKEYLLEIQKTT